MVGTSESPPEETIRELAQRAQALESELRRIRQSIKAEEKKLPLTPHTSQATPQPTEDAPAIYLQPLPPYDSLRHKWSLGTGLDVKSTTYAGDITSLTGENTSYLRLFGLTPDGHPWEQRIYFADIAQHNGIYIGRDESKAQIIIPDNSVSRCHLLIELTHQGLVITDENSTNGSYVNNRRITFYENRFPLKNGDTLTLGDVLLQAEIVNHSHH